MPMPTREQQRAYQREWMRRRREDWIKANGPCTKCGSWDDLEVDHIAPATKTYQPAGIWSRKAEIRVAELAKCQVLCGRCHQAKTTAQLLREPKHGTRARYSRKRNPCRCDLCRETATAYERARRAKAQVRFPGATATNP